MNIDRVVHRIRLHSRGEAHWPAALALVAGGAQGAADTPRPCLGNSAKDIMVRVGPLWIDKFEASIWSEIGGGGTPYPQGDPRYPSWFPRNGNWTKPLYAASVAGVSPSAFVTWFQAQQACALAGKRLPTNSEWQMAAAGTPDPELAGDGVTQCDYLNGINEAFHLAAPQTSEPIDATSDAMPAAIARGGEWTRGDAARVFSLEAMHTPASLDNATGFRCVR